MWKKDKDVLFLQASLCTYLYYYMGVLCVCGCRLMHVHVHMYIYKQRFGRSADASAHTPHNPNKTGGGLRRPVPFHLPRTCRHFLSPKPRRLIVHHTYIQVGLTNYINGLWQQATECFQRCDAMLAPVGGGCMHTIIHMPFT